MVIVFVLNYSKAQRMCSLQSHKPERGGRGGGTNKEAAEEKKNSGGLPRKWYAFHSREFI